MLGLAIVWLGSIPCGIHTRTLSGRLYTAISCGYIHVFYDSAPTRARSEPRLEVTLNDLYKISRKPGGWPGAFGLNVGSVNVQEIGGGAYPARSWCLTVALPIWLPTLLCIATLLIPKRARRTARAPHCNCGYDLTGNQSGICPECGTRIALRMEASS